MRQGKERARMKLWIRMVCKALYLCDWVGDGRCTESETRTGWSWFVCSLGCWLIAAWDP